MRSWVFPIRMLTISHMSSNNKKDSNIISRCVSLPLLIISLSAFINLRSKVICAHGHKHLS